MRSQDHCKGMEGAKIAIQRSVIGNYPPGAGVGASASAGNIYHPILVPCLTAVSWSTAMWLQAISIPNNNNNNIKEAKFLSTHFSVRPSLTNSINMKIVSLRVCL